MFSLLRRQPAVAISPGASQHCWANVWRHASRFGGERWAPRLAPPPPGEPESRGEGGRSEFLRLPPRLLLVAAEAAEPPSGAIWEARPLPMITVSKQPALVEDRGIAATDPNAVPLHEADFIVSAGNGVNDWASFHEV